MSLEAEVCMDCYNPNLTLFSSDVFFKMLNIVLAVICILVVHVEIC